MALFLALVKALQPYELAIRNSGEMIPGEIIENVWKLVLDAIELTGCIHLNLMDTDALMPFVKRALGILLSKEQHEKILLAIDAACPPQEEKVRYTAEKWLAHIEELVKAKVLEEVHLKHECKWRRAIKIFGRYFAVPKGREKARAIFNGKPVNALYRSPPSTNTCDPPRVVKIVAEMHSETNSKRYFVMMYWRHYFHQILQQEECRSHFGLAVRTKEKGVRYFKWRTVLWDGRGRPI